LHELLVIFLQEFDLKSIVWDEETVERWKTFALGKSLIPAPSVLPTSPSRSRPVFQGMRQKAEESRNSQTKNRIE
jgi:hypothetical protein